MQMQKFMDMMEGLRRNLLSGRTPAKVQGMKVLAWDPDSSAVREVTGYVFDEEDNTVTLQTDDNA